MIDTHCHLVPDVDDGPQDLAGSLRLARLLWRDDVSHVVCTPHFSSRFSPPADHLRAMFEALRAGLESSGPKMTVQLAAEVSAERALGADVDVLRRHTIGERFLLVEIAPSTPIGILGAIQTRLAAADILVVFGHPERSRAVQRHPRALAELRDDGCLVQVVAPSLIGDWGSGARATAWRLLTEGLVDLLASDAHGSRRPPKLRAAARLVERQLGPHAVAHLTREAPARVLRGIHPRADDL